MTGVVISSAARTAVGSYGKSLAGVPPTDLGATAVTSALERAQTAPDMVDQVVFGNVIHTAPEDMYTARVVGMKAGIPKESPAFTVNRLCGTGVQAIVSAAQALAVMQDLELDPAKVNPNGGAIALGHPISATGAVITAKILSEMEREDHELGLVTLCIGGGQGIALLLGRDN